MKLLNYDRFWFGLVKLVMLVACIPLSISIVNKYVPGSAVGYIIIGVVCLIVCWAVVAVAVPDFRAAAQRMAQDQHNEGDRH